MRSLTAFILTCSLFSLILGCGGADNMSMPGGEKATMSAEPMADSFDGDLEQASETSLPETVDVSQIGQEGEAKPNDDKPKTFQRQIVYTAQLNLIVEEFDGLPERVQKLVSEHGGFVANSNLQGSSGSPRSGSWTIRIPVRQYGTFLNSVKSLGEFQNMTTGSREVTAEYYDVQARIKNKQRQEGRLLDLLEKRTGKLQDILQVEEQLARIRGEIERMQGRMRVLKDLTSLSTITLSIQEIKGYQPPEAPTFGNRISRTWNGTLVALIETGQNLVIGIVAVGPWLVILSIPVLLFIGLIRLLIRKRTVR